MFIDSFPEWTLCLTQLILTTFPICGKVYDVTDCDVCVELCKDDGPMM